MPLVRLDGRSVHSLPALDGQRTDYVDTVVSGFVLRVSPSGARTYALRYWRDGKGQRFTLGDASRISLADARDLARQLLAQVAMGADPQGQKIQTRRQGAHAASFAELAERFLLENEARLRRNTLRQWQGIVRREVRPAFRAVTPEQVTRSDVRELVKRISRDRPYMANRVFEVIRRVFTWAVGEDLVAASPCVGLRKPGAEKPRERTLTSDEIRAVWQALDAEEQAGECVRLAFFTGARLSEVLGAEWAEVDLAARLWTIPPERSKNADPHPIPLSTGAMDILARMRARNGEGEFVFASPRPGAPVCSVQRCMDRVTTRAKVAFRFHDIRRTVATGLATLGAADYVVEAALGHRQPKLRRTYNRYYPIRELRTALEGWYLHLEGIARPGKRGLVVPMQPSGGRGTVDPETRQVVLA